MTSDRTKPHLLRNDIPVRFWTLGEVAVGGAQLTRPDGEPLRMRPSMTVWPVRRIDEREDWNMLEYQLGGVIRELPIDYAALHSPSFQRVQKRTLYKPLAP